MILLGIELTGPATNVGPGEVLGMTDGNDLAICHFDVREPCEILGFMAWEDLDGSCYISLIDGLRGADWQDVPLYRLSVRWDYGASAIITIRIPKWRREIDIFVYPMRDEAWSTSEW